MTAMIRNIPKTARIAPEPGPVPYRILLIILSAAFVLRFGSALLFPNIARPDEIFQNLEPAFRLVTGHGVLTWEWREGIRSPLFPALLAGPIALAHALGQGPSVYVPLILALLSLVSTLVVAAAFFTGWHKAGRQGAILCGALSAIWPELVYFGPKYLSEIQAGNLLALAAYMGLVIQHPASPRRLFGCGVLCGLTFCVRFHLAPALALIALLACRNHTGRWAALIFGGMLPLAAMGIADWIQWGAPFASVWQNITFNIVQHVSEEFGVASRTWYIEAVTNRWLFSALLMAVFFALGILRAPGWAAITGIVVLSHSMIAHKEISFVYAALPPFMIVAGLGATRLFEPLYGAGRHTLAITLPVMIFAAMALSVTTRTREAWFNQSAMLQAMEAMRADPGICGIALQYPDAPWYETGGNALLGRDVPFYQFQTAAGGARLSPTVNAALGGRALPALIPGLRIRQCWTDPGGELCLARAEAGRTCTPAPALGINAVPDLGRTKAHFLQADAPWNEDDSPRVIPRTTRTTPR